jgi:nicotinamide-nucleotide amidase
MQAGILIIGDEILSGNVQDTNSSFAARLLFSNSIPVSRVLAVSDTEEGIREGLSWLYDKVDLLITTGGLGPTKDDITKAAIASFFNSELIFNTDVYETLRERFAKRGKTLNELNKAQAMVPAVAEVIPNDVGTAPVFWIEQNNKVVITLPGVPSEMRFLLEHVLLERLKAKFVHRQILQKTVHLIGIPESDLAMKIAGVEKKIEDSCSPDEKYKLAYLPDMGTIRLQITGTGDDRHKLDHEIEYFKEEIKTAAGKYIFGYDHDILATHIGKLLKDRDTTLSTAESCTGGYLAHLVTSVTGSADYYQGSIISYDNSVKVKELGVKQETLDQFGAVSEETCREMLEGCLKKFDTTYVMATTGIAGPTGGTEGKPIGVVWIGVSSKYKMNVRRYHFDRNRLENIHLFSITALDMLRKLILGLE